MSCLIPPGSAIHSVGGCYPDVTLVIYTVQNAFLPHVPINTCVISLLGAGFGSFAHAEKRIYEKLYEKLNLSQGHTRCVPELEMPGRGCSSSCGMQVGITFHIR